MKKIIETLLSLMFAVSVFAPFVYGDKKLNIVTTTLDASDFVKQVGGEKVSVYSLYNGQYDFHFYEPRPSEVVKLKKADAVVVYGLAHDEWLQPLIEAARNPNISFGGKGYIDMADGATVCKVPAGRIDGRMGHVHPYGACGYLFSHRNVKIAVENIYKGLVKLDPENKDYYEKNKNNYLTKVDETFEKLKDKMAPFKGTKILQFHESWDYFAETFGLKMLAALEPKPGIPPSPAHLAKLVNIVREEKPKFILVEPYYPRKPVKFIVEQTGIKEIRAPQYVGSIRGIDTYLGNLEYIVDEIIKVMK